MVTRVASQGLDPFLDAPMTQSWMVSLQRTIGNDLFVEADYAGTYSDRLHTMTDVNRFPGDLVANNGTLTRLNSSFSALSIMLGRSGVSDSHYGSFMVSKRYSQGLSLREISSPLGKATDYNSTFCTGPSGCGLVLDALDVARQKGRAYLQHRQAPDPG